MTIRERESPAGQSGANSTPNEGSFHLIASRQVSWWDVHTFVSGWQLCNGVAQFPLVGTPAWCALADDDPVKWAAIFDAAQHWALRLETGQQALADASREVSAAADWSSTANEIWRRRGVYIPRRVA